MNRVAITAGGIITPLGSLDSTWKSMCEGRSGLIAAAHPLVAPHYALGTIEGLTGCAGNWVRMKSLLDKLVEDIKISARDTQLIVATTKGAIDELGGPMDKIEGQPWQLADYLNTIFQFSKKPKTVSAACASGTLAIIQATMLVAAGKCDHALVIGVDLIGDFILAGFDSLKGHSESGAKPFDQKRDGLSLGDGAGWLMLSSEDKLADSKSLAWIDGYGVSCDASHITAPCRNGTGLKRVFDQLSTFSLSPPGGINAHGTGTIYNDAMELLTFDEKCLPGTPVCSGKGAIGHSLGASGVIEAMLSICSLEQMALPPTVGLVKPESTRMVLSGDKMLPLLNPSIISTNSGFGGINAAVRFSVQ